MSDDRGTVPFNAGWLFGAFTDGCELPGFDYGPSGGGNRTRG